MAGSPPSHDLAGFTAAWEELSLDAGNACNSIGTARPAHHVTLPLFDQALCDDPSDLNARATGLIGQGCRGVPYELPASAPAVRADGRGRDPGSLLAFSGNSTGSIAHHACTNPLCGGRIRVVKGGGRGPALWPCRR